MNGHTSMRLAHSIIDDRHGDADRARLAHGTSKPSPRRVRVLAGQLWSAIRGARPGGVRANRPDAVVHAGGTTRTT